MGKARRKDKADVAISAGSGGSALGSPSGSTLNSVGGTAFDAADHKLYLEEAVLERKVPEADLRQLTDLPPGLDLNEWLASHTIAFFEHVNLLYGAVSEYCTPSTCPEMMGPGQRQYTWIDEKGKKIRLAAPQYIDYVMTYAQRTVNDDSIFPTKFALDFPPAFETILRKIHRLLFHVVAHLYHQHFRELLLLGLHGHLHCLFAHLILFNGRFRLIDEKETEILQDLVVALRLQPSDVTAPSCRSSQPSPTPAVVSAREPLSRSESCAESSRRLSTIPAPTPSQAQLCFQDGVVDNREQHMNVASDDRLRTRSFGSIHSTAAVSNPTPAAATAAASAVTNSATASFAWTSAESPR